MKRRAGRRGLTLVEIMTGVFVLGATLLVATAIFPLSAFLRDRSSGYSQAASIAQRKLEQIRRLPSRQVSYTGLLNAGIIDEGSTSPYSFTTRDNLPGVLSQGTGAIELSGVGTDLVHANLVITWRGLRGTTQEVRAMTLVSNKELRLEQ